MKKHERSPEEGIVTYGRPFAAATAVITATTSTGAAAALPALGSAGLLIPQAGIAMAIPLLPVAAIGIGVAASGVAIFLARGKKRRKKQKRGR